MYQFGKGVAQDDAEATKWYNLAAEQGLPMAQNNLAWQYWRGRGGIPLDLLRAHMLFNLAAAGGIADAASDREKVAAENDARTNHRSAEASSRVEEACTYSRDKVKQRIGLWLDCAVAPWVLCSRQKCFGLDPQ